MIMARNIKSGLVAAVLGAPALIRGGYAARDWSAHAQTTSRDVLITALNELAAAISNAGKAQAVRAGAVRVAAGAATRVEIVGLISQSYVPGNAALSAAMARADQALKASDLH
jgi:hypothetical protein